MKTKNIALIAVISFISLTSNAYHVSLKNMYKTENGTEASVSIQTNNGTYNVAFGKNEHLGKLDTITKLTIKTGQFVPVDITKYIVQLKAEAKKLPATPHEATNALLIVHPKDQPNAPWNIQRQWQIITQIPNPYY